jgi:hypothetical protein
MVQIKASKPIGQIKKDDLITIDGKKYHVDAQLLLIDHGQTKEMGIELYDDKDIDYQLRYFADQVEETLEFYELVKEVMYERRDMQKISW